MIYKIIGTYRGGTEEIDEAETRKEAEYLLQEYRLAFGQGWYLRIRAKRITCAGVGK